ncbi:MAG: zinc ribbon domain-containing protein, partial [Actinobacteria bacterium]|nr:zinc ribbon domain-containing protein [Actinomycetota bacterium]
LVEGMALGVSGGDYVAVGPKRILGCASCGYTWELPFSSGVRACEASCPNCGSYTARRVDSRGAGKGKPPAGRHGCRGSGRGRPQGDQRFTKGDA